MPTSPSAIAEVLGSGLEMLAKLPVYLNINPLTLNPYPLCLPLKAVILLTPPRELRRPAFL